jgi:uncharacterized membrane protein
VIFNPFYKALAALGFTDPVHPALVHMPIGLVVGALFFGFAALIWKRPLLGLSAQHCLVLAWLFFFPTVLFGVMDWQHYYHGAWLVPIKVKIGLAIFLFVLLSIGLILIFKGRGDSKAILVIYVLSFCTVVLLGYFGGHLVFGGRSRAAPKEFKVGMKIFDANCIACHPNGGNVFVADMPLKGAPYLENVDKLIAFIRDPRLRNGAKGPMPDFPPSDITDQEVRELYRYLIHEYGLPAK